MTSTGQGWTLIARFSNDDAKNWMDDTGHWWYDKSDAAGDTSDPSINADMMSPAFFMVSGSEFKITRSIELCCRLRVTVWVDRRSVLKSRAMVTSGMA